ncbi:MAG: parB-like partition protein [Firmicutes bacterium]|nr:parB-like partition protein [Bacillota bacterium]
MRNLAKLLGINSEETVMVEPPPAPEAGYVALDSEVIELSAEELLTNPYQPRKTFSEESLQELAASIREHGIIQPILVRKTNNGYEIIAGERRMRASRIVGLKTVPVIVREINDKDMAELAMIENLQREDLHYLEEAEGFHHLLVNFGLTQEDLARRMGKNQSTVANKLRLLRLSAEVRQQLVENNLTERHARALLKLEDPVKQQMALNAIKENNLNVRETEDMVGGILDDISREIAKKAPKQNVVKIIRDVRIFINTINSVVAEMKKVGLKVKVTQEQDDDFVNISLRIPKRRK